MTFRAISLDERDEWLRALSCVPHGFGHTWEANRAAWLTRPGPTWLFVWNDPLGATASAPFVERRTANDNTDITTPFGFAGFSGSGAIAGFPEAWTLFAQERGYISGYQALHPCGHHDSLYRPADAYADNSLYLLDLTQGEEALHAALHRNRRRELRAWPATKGRLVEDREALTDFLVDHHRTFLERVGAPSSYMLESESVRLLGDADSTLLLGTEKGGRLVSAYVLGVTPWAADAILHVSLPEGRTDTAVLVWAGVERLLKRGVPVMNLGGGASEGDSIARAKQRFGARKVPLVRVKEVYDEGRFVEECRRVGVDPTSRTGYFPPYRRPAVSQRAAE